MLLKAWITEGLIPLSSVYPLAYLFIIKSTRCTNFTYLFWYETLLSRTVRLSIIRNLFTVHSAMVFAIQVCRQLSSRTWSCSKAVYKPVWHIPLLSVQWINSWWGTDEVSESCRISYQNKFVKLVHLVDFTENKLFTMHGHMKEKLLISLFIFLFTFGSHKFVFYNIIFLFFVCIFLPYVLFDILISTLIWAFYTKFILN